MARKRKKRFFNFDSFQEKALYYLGSVIRNVFSFVSRTALYCFITFVILLLTKKANLNDLAWGLINTYYIEDYFCALLYCSGGILLFTLILYAIAILLFGKSDENRHFLRETLCFLIKNLLFPLLLIKSFFEETSIPKKFGSFLSLLIFIATIVVLVYGCTHWI